MTERERLIDLIINAKRADPETGSFTEFLADFLLAYGVIVPGDDRPPAAFLRELVKAEMEGRCTVLPCKMGGTVYVVTAKGGGRLSGKEIVECKVTAMRVKRDGLTIGYSCRGRYSNGNYYNGNFTFGVYKSLGKTVFRTREEAEAALEKMKEAQA